MYNLYKVKVCDKHAEIIILPFGFLNISKLSDRYSKINRVYGIDTTQTIFNASLHIIIEHMAESSIDAEDLNILLGKVGGCIYCLLPDNEILRISAKIKDKIIEDNKMKRFGS